MSGTFFRTDCAPIKFVEYGDNGRPQLHCPPYKYSQAVADKVVRPVACKYLDVELRCISEDDGVSTENLFSIPNSDKRFGKIMREVFHPEGDCVRRMIHDIDEHMTRTRMRFSNAAALFTCRPGRSGASEDKHVHQIAQKIRQYTGQEVVVVTHNDNNAQGKIDAFRNGSSPYLVAVNMVSEGVDIPRLRAIGMMRFISSEMMFRQIIGRAVRMTGDEDGTAAMIFMPKFQLMHQFGMNLECEALEGLRDLLCDRCGQYPCVCPCRRCGQEPCVCEPNEPQEPRIDDFAVLEANPLGGGGSVSQDEVEEALITIARSVMQRSAHRMWWSQRSPGRLCHRALRMAVTC